MIRDGGVWRQCSRGRPVTKPLRCKWRNQRVEELDGSEAGPTAMQFSGFLRTAMDRRPEAQVATLHVSESHDGRKHLDDGN